MPGANAAHQRTLRAAVLLLGAAPLLALLLRAALDELGANPVEEITHETGEWALRFLLLTLAVTPARRFLGWSWLAPERRSFGLFAFGYASLHFATYLALDLEFQLGALAEDILERPYITAGFTGFVSLLPLAATSTRASIKRLGPRWRKLHRLAYLAAGAAIAHYLWLAKADLREPLIYAAILVGLLATRLVRRGR